MSRAGAEVIAGHLARAGCRFAFGVPGGEVLALVDALERAGLRFVLARHENAAGFMAEGAWHASLAGGRPAPGVLVATLGPGVANAVNVVVNARQDRVPLIFLTGCVDAAEAETFTHQVFDHQALLREVAKASFRASRGAVGAVIAKALAIAMDGQPGPVHVDVPIGAAEGLEEADSPPRPPAAPAGPMEGPALAAARATVAGARRPLLLAGVDAVNQRAEAALGAFARRLGAPVLATYKAKGMLADSDPLSLGAAGLSPKADAILLPLVAEADVVVLAGYDPIEMRGAWRHPFHERQSVIDIAAAPPTHMMHRGDHLFVGAVAATLDALSPGESRATWPNDRIGAAKAALARAFAPEPGWGPGAAFATIRRLLPANAVVTADSGAHRILLSQMWPLEAPRLLLQSSAFCTMGCALPMAIGHRLAGDRTVVAVMGDAGLEMVLGELATLRDLAVPVIVVVMVDRRLALIDLKQQASNRRRTGVSIGATDYVGVAAAMGGAGIEVDNVPALETAMGEALARRDGFSLIACRIAPDAYRGRF